MDERLFWTTMNPARLHALYNARFEREEAPPAAPEQRKSLSAYLMGGG